VGEQPQFQEFAESVSLVVSSIFGIFSSRGISDTLSLLLRTNTSADVSKNILYALHKRLNCQEFLAHLEAADPAAFQTISPDFFNNITKHFGRSQSIENYARVIFQLTRLYGPQHIFFRNFFSIIRDCEETQLLLSYAAAWDYSKLSETRPQIALRIILCSMDRMVNSHQIGEFVALLPKYQEVAAEGASPETTYAFNKFLFHTLLGLAVKRNVAKLREILPGIIRSGLDISLISLNKLIDCFNKNCPEIDLIELVMEGILLRKLAPNTITYNCYLECHAVIGNLAKCLDIVDRMKQEGLVPDSYTVATMIKGCRHFPIPSLLAAHRAIFQLYVSSGCRDRIVINSLIDQCVSSSDDEFAETVFNYLIAGNIEETDHITYNIMLKLAVKNRDLSMARRLTEQVVARGYRPNLSTYNSLLNLCFKTGKLEDGFHFYNQLKAMDTQPDSFTFSIMLNGAKTHAYDPKFINKILDDVRLALASSTQRLDEVVFNTILEILFTYDLLDQFDFFHTEMKRQNIPESSFTFSVVLKKLSKMEDFEKINLVFDELLEKKITVSDFNYGFILDYFAKVKRMEWALAIFRKLRASGVELSSIIFTTMIKGFINMGDYANALVVFGEIKHLIEQPGMIITYNCALDVLVHQDRLEDALVLLGEIERTFKADLISYSTIIKGLCKANRRTQAFALIRQMIDAKIEYDVSIMNLFLENCAASDDHKTGITSFEYLQKRKVLFNEITLGIMVKIYGAQFKLKSAFALIDLFKEIKMKPSLIFFTNLIHVSFFNKKPNKAELAFTLLKKDELRGDRLMYSKLIEGLLRFKQTERIPTYIQAAITDDAGVKAELWQQLTEIFEDERETMLLLDRLRECGRVAPTVSDVRGKVKNNFHQTNTQNFKNQIWQKNREKQEAERQQQTKEEECRGTENPGRKGFEVSEAKPEKTERFAENRTFKQPAPAPRQPGTFVAKQPMVLHNFRLNKKAD
jgi:pentatricopeptide repeat protein